MSGYYLEFGHSTLWALHGEQGLEVPLERLASGELTEDCKTLVTSELRKFFLRTPWQPRRKILCAIGARGVTLRRLTLPATAAEQVQRLLRLQIESQFPLGPDELAWGYCPLGGPLPAQNGAPAQQEFLIAAARKGLLENYAALLTACGAKPVFTLAGLARNSLCPALPGSHAVLELGSTRSELACFENGVPGALRVIGWGGAQVTRAIGEKLAVGAAEAQRLLSEVERSAGAGSPLEQVIDGALDSLAQALDGPAKVQRIYLSGCGANTALLAKRLSGRLPAEIACQLLPIPAGEGPGRSAAVLGLRHAAETAGGTPPLVLQVKTHNGAEARPSLPWPWVARAAGLAALLLVFPYLQALVLRPYLAAKLARLKSDRGRLVIIDKEWSFLQHLKQNQPPYLDTLFILAKAAPPGAKLDALSMNEHGELSWRCSMHDSKQVAEFRSKLIDSGLFDTVTVEEQTTAPNHQKVALRMSGRWKPLNQRLTLALGPTPDEIQKAKTRVRNPPGVMPMMPGAPLPMPGMMPPGSPGPHRVARPPAGFGRPAGTHQAPGGTLHSPTARPANGPALTPQPPS